LPQALGGERAHRRYSRSIRNDAVDRVHSFLSGFRLLEAAGVSELIARGQAGDAPLRKAPDWWRALADTARSYRTAIYRTSSGGVRTIDEWCSVHEFTPRPADLVAEQVRLGGEYHGWLTEILGGQAYVAWLVAYVAVAEMDGERALRALEKCQAIIREFADPAGLDERASAYDLLQSTANALRLFLPLPEHPLRDMRRFALLPASLRSGYGSTDAYDLQSHRGAGDPRPHPA
jgi:hypothetical protein